MALNSHSDKKPPFSLYEVIGVFLSHRNTIQTCPTFSLGAVIGGLHNYDRSLVTVAKSPVLSTTGKFNLPTNRTKYCLHYNFHNGGTFLEAYLAPTHPCLLVGWLVRNTFRFPLCRCP